MIRRVVQARPNVETEIPAGKRYSLDEAFAYCERIARAHYENFPVASRLTPERLRPHIWALYAFARTADDFADEPRDADRRAQALTEWQEQLERAFHGEADHPIFVALTETIERCQLPFNALSDLLSSFTMDLSVARYPTWTALSQYGAYAAHPVGRLVLYVFGYRDSRLHAFSDDLCMALHLTNSIQDVAIDLARDRIYLPEEDRAHFGVTEKMLKGGVMTPEIESLLRFEIARARSLYERGRPLIDLVGDDLALELSLIFHSGLAVLDKVEQVGFDVLTRRPTLGRADKARVMLRTAPERLSRVLHGKI